MKVNPRAIHRNIAYFYLGLIIAFAISGILLNHRQSWNPARYTYQTKELQVTPPVNKEAVNDDYIAQISGEWNLQEKPRGFRVRENKLSIDYSNDRIEIDIVDGNGIRESYIQTPLISQLRQLHIDTSSAWIWYSDIFGLAMLTLAVTGVFIQKGDKGYLKGGWKLTTLGVIFPLIFLFLIS